MKIVDLKKGDIYQDGPNTWDGLFRFHNYYQLPNGQLRILLMGLNFQGKVENALANSFTNRPANHEVYIPVFYKCEFKKTKGIPCIPVNNHRNFFPQNLNQINISNKFCDRNDYWYEYAELKY